MLQSHGTTTDPYTKQINPFQTYAHNVLHIRFNVSYHLRLVLQVPSSPQVSPTTCVSIYNSSHACYIL